MRLSLGCIADPAGAASEVDSAGFPSGELWEHMELLVNVAEDMHHAHGIACNREATRNLLFRRGQEVLEVSSLLAGGDPGRDGV